MRLFDLHCDTLTRGARGVAPCADWVQTYAAFLPDGLSGEEALSHYDSLMATAARWQEESSAFHVFRGAFSPRGCTAILSVENGGMLADVPYVFDRFSVDGIAIVGLTWNGVNAWAHGCGSPHGGLTPAGVQAVRELERRDMIVDVSHLSERGFWQLDAVATQPFIATHSNMASVTPHPRNLTDEQFAAIRDRGGLVGMNVYPPFLGDDSPQAFCRHVERCWSLGGEKTVCIGSDVDGFDTPPISMSYLSTLYEYMTAQGYDSALIEDLFYENARRFFDRWCDRKEERV